MLAAGRLGEERSGGAFDCGVELVRGSSMPTSPLSLLVLKITQSVRFPVHAIAPDNGAQKAFRDGRGRPRTSEELPGEPAAVIDSAAGQRECRMIPFVPIRFSG